MSTGLLLIFLILLAIIIISFIFVIENTNKLITGAAELGGYRKINIFDLGPDAKDVKYIDNGEEHIFPVKSSYFKDIKSGEQIQTIIRFGNINEYARLVQILGKHISVRGPEKIKTINSLLSKVLNNQESDNYVYSELCKQFNRDEEQRSLYQAQSMFYPLQEYFTQHKIKNLETYLDLGCGNGTITANLKNMMQPFSKKASIETHCVEVDQSLTHKDIKYHYVNPEVPYRLPFLNDHFNVITAFMSLHHVKNLDSMIQEIHRVLKPGGILFIKEHDSWNAFDAMLVDIEHAIFMHCNKENFNNYILHYKNYWGWIETLGKYFELQDAEYYYTTPRNEISPTRAWWGIFKKIK